MNIYYKFIRSKFVKIKSPNYIIAGGDYSIKHPQAQLMDQSSKLIWAHSFDYDQFLNLNRKSEISTDEEYAVFYKVISFI